MKKRFLAVLTLISITLITTFIIEGGYLESKNKVANNPYSGGETTVFNTSREAFAKPLANLATSDLRKFTFGNKMFNTNNTILIININCDNKTNINRLLR